MKKSMTLLTRFSILCVVLLVSVSSQAQDNGGKHYSDFRLFGGVNLSSLSTEGTQFTLIDSIIHRKGVDAEIGFQGGLSMTFGNRFYVSPGIWYTKFTTNTYHFDPNNIGNSKPDFENESSISVITIPVRVGFRFFNAADQGVFNMRIYGGITGQHVSSVSSTGNESTKLNKDDYENLILSANAGFGVDVLFLFADIGYDLGLTNFEKANAKSRHNSMYVNVGFKFSL